MTHPQLFKLRVLSQVFQVMKIGWKKLNNFFMLGIKSRTTDS